MKKIKHFNCNLFSCTDILDARNEICIDDTTYNMKIITNKWNRRIGNCVFKIFKLFDFPISYRNDFKKRNNLKLRCKTNHLRSPTVFCRTTAVTTVGCGKTAGCHLKNEVKLNGTPTSLLLSQHLEVLYQ